MDNWVRHVVPPQRLYLAWQAPDHMGNRFRWAIGELLADSDSRMSLRYFTDADDFKAVNQGHSIDEAKALGFEGYPGFRQQPEPHWLGVAEALARRLPPASRPDFDAYKRQFRLPSDVSLPLFSMLAHTEAKLPSDGFSVVDPFDGPSRERDLVLEVAGHRYYPPTVPIVVGQQAEIEAEPENKFDRGAVKVTVGGQKIGNINRLQAPAFLQWLGKDDISVFVERLNGRADSPRVFVFVRVRAARGQAAA